MSRKYRGLTQPLYIVECRMTDECFDCDIMGTTGNVYTVKMLNEPICTCPDFSQRGMRCKHIYFLLIKGLKISHDDAEDLFYDDEDLEDMRERIHNTAHLFVSDAKRKKYKKMKKSHEGGVTDNKVAQKSFEGASCPICLDDLKETDHIVYCQYTCGNNYHKQCIDEFKKAFKGRFKCTLCQGYWEQSYVELPNYVNIM